MDREDRHARRRFRRRGWTALAVLAAGAAGLGCDASNRVCVNNCPPLEGDWAVAFASGTVSSECQMIGAAPVDGVLSVTRQGAALDAIFRGAVLSGTAYDTYDFSLHGQDFPDGGAAPDTISFRGRYVPAPDGGSAGAQLVGQHDATLTLRRTVGGNITCRYVRDYAAIRR